ncbi:MAG: hypothetical protein CMC15_15885 [Flavobacteriaceae bacterium]|nr:hypothetical protein [Flavobacteriaceae bacterium]
MADRNSEFDIDSKVIMIGDITYAFRGSGNVDSSSTDPDVVSPTNKNIPQITIGLASYDELPVVLGYKEDNGTDNSNLNSFNSVGAVGLDGLFVPYTNSVNSDTPFLPHYEVATSSGVGTSSGIFNKSLDPFNPFNSLEEAGKSHTTNWYESGHNISFALYDNPLDSEMTDLYPTGVSGIREDAPVDFNFEKDFFTRGKAEVSGIKSIALRSPLVLSGWGFDTSGVQVPAASDAAYNPSTWKTGPLDVRWDDARKVWSAAAKSNMGILQVVPDADFSSVDTTFNGEVLRGGVGGYATGDDIENISNVMGDEGTTSDKCFVYVDTDTDGNKIKELLRVQC